MSAIVLLSKDVCVVAVGPQYVLWGTICTRGGPPGIAAAATARHNMPGWSHSRGALVATRNFIYTYSALAAAAAAGSREM